MQAVPPPTESWPPPRQHGHQASLTSPIDTTRADLVSLGLSLGIVSFQARTSDGSLEERTGVPSGGPWPLTGGPHTWGRPSRSHARGPPCRIPRPGAALPHPTPGGRPPDPTPGGRPAASHARGAPCPIPRRGAALPHPTPGGALPHPTPGGGPARSHRRSGPSRPFTCCAGGRPCPVLTGGLDPESLSREDFDISSC